MMRKGYPFFGNWLAVQLPKFAMKVIDLCRYINIFEIKFKITINKAEFMIVCSFLVDFQFSCGSFLENSQRRLLLFPKERNYIPTFL